MPDAIEKISLKQLQNVAYQLDSVFQLSADGQEIICRRLIRVVPGKRLVFIGEFNKTKVIIKLFVHASRAKKHWLRECAGAGLLSGNNILTPEKLASGVSDEGIYFIIFRYIKGCNLAEFWLKNNQFNREQKLKQLMLVLEQHHSSGLAHQDLHYANFLLGANDNIYTLDGEEVKQGIAPLQKKVRLKNLALFLAQTFDLNKSSSLFLLDDYIRLTSIPKYKRDADDFWKWIKQYQQQRIEQYLKKIIRECTDVIHEKQPHGYTLCRREYHNQAVQQLLDHPEQFFQDENSAYLKQGNTCTVKSVLVDNEKYVIKRYNPKGIVYELMHKGQMSRARKSWINAHLLCFIGVLTPRPVALIEQQPALGKRCSYFICKYVEGQNSWDFFCDKDKSEQDKQLAADKLLAALKKLCEYKITHGDLKGSNFLIHNDQVWMLDLDAMCQYKANWRYRKNWLRDKQRFLKNWEKKPCYEPWKLYFVMPYLKESKRPGFRALMHIDIIQSEISTPFEQQWADKDPFVETEKLQGDIFRELEARKTLRFSFLGKSYFIKIHRGIGWFEIFENLLRLRLPVLGAENEYLAIKKLEKLHIDTMHIVAYVVKGKNPARQQSFIITEDLINTISLEDFCADWKNNKPQAALKSSLIAKLAHISRTLHQNGINHRDYYICHFLLDISKGIENLDLTNLKISLIDLHRAQIRDKTPQRWIVKDIASLYFSVMDLGLTQRDLFRFMKLYHNCSLRECFTIRSDFWQKVEKQGQKLWQRKQRKGDAI